MSSIGTGYDLSASQFSPDGRVFQVEYAQKAAENSGTAIGIRGKDGVVFGVEKLVTSKLYETGANKRIFNIDRHIGMAVAGLLADARQIVETSKEEASNYRSNYGNPIPLKHLTDRVSMFVHAHTLYSSVRPFGVSCLLGSYDADGPQLYCIDPSGISFGYQGCATGKAKQAAKTEIEKIKMKDMPCADLVKEVAKIFIDVTWQRLLNRCRGVIFIHDQRTKFETVSDAKILIYIVHDEVKDKNFELELSWVGEMTNGKHQMVPKNVFIEAEKFAKESLEESDDSDDDEL